MSPIFDHTLLKLIQVAVSLFAGVLFLQSGFDKVIDFSGSKSYIQSVFAKTFLNSVSTVLFIVITILEVSAGITSFLGGIYYFGRTGRFCCFRIRTGGISYPISLYRATYCQRLCRSGFFSELFLIDGFWALSVFFARLKDDLKRNSLVLKAYSL